MSVRALQEGWVHAIADRLPVLISYTQADGRMLYANPALLAACGKPQDLPAGLPACEVLHPEMIGRVAAAVDDALAGRTVTFVDSNSASGSLRHYELTFLPDCDSGGEVRGIYVVGYDVTERVQRENSVASREQQLQGLFDTMTEGVAIHDRFGRVVNANPAAELLLSLSRAQVLAFTPVQPDWSGLLPDGTPLSPEELPVMRTLRTGRPVRDAIVGVRVADGAVRWLKVNVNPLFGGPGAAPTGAVATFADVTELHRSLQRIRELAQRLEAVRALERRELAITLHEGLAQDLFAMRLALSNLRRELGTSGPSAVDGVMAALDRCMNGTRELAGSLRPTGPADMPIGQGSGQHASYFQSLSRLRIRIHEEQPLVVSDEPTRLLLFRAAQEALSNVARHAGATEVDIHLVPHAGDVELRISDNGKGLAPGSLDKSGSLGLLGLRERARAVGGSFSIESGPQGTTLTLRLPLAARAGSVA